MKYIVKAIFECSLNIKLIVIIDLLVKCGKAKQQNQHGIIDVEPIRYERQQTHRAHDLSEEKMTLV